MYVDHVEQHGEALFERVCKLDLEGIVAKLKSGPYVSEREKSTRRKILNPTIRSGWVGKNYSSVTGTKNVGTPALWHVASYAKAATPTGQPGPDGVASLATLRIKASAVVSSCSAGANRCIASNTNAQSS